MKGEPMRRREFITLLGGAAAAWPMAARAQQRAAMPVIGYLRSGSRATSSQTEAAFRQGLGSMGFVEGRNVAIDYRYSENQNERLPALAADLVSGQVSLIYAANNGPAVIAKAATTAIPIVFRIGGDPIQLGLVSSFNRPGGNLTGVSFLSTTTGAIRLQMLHEAVPSTEAMGFAHQSK
jgi:putative ABC transport system substrate-binding protein